MSHRSTSSEPGHAGAGHGGRRRALAGVVVALALVLTACAGGGGAPAGAEEVGARQVRVTTTTNWHTDLARQIGGERAEVTGLMGPGVDPHLYEASAGDVDTLSGADLVVWNGLQLEGKMEDVFAEIGESGVAVVAVGEAVPEPMRIPVRARGEEFDPHIWFDVEAWKLAGRAVAEAYRRVDPQHAAGYDQRLARFVARLDEVDAAVTRRLAQVPAQSRVLVTSHDAFGYFARAYGFRVAPIQGISTAAEATTADIGRVAETVAANRLGAVFLESSVPRQTIEAVLAASAAAGQQTAVGGELFGDSLGEPGTPLGGYAGAMERNADVIADGLRPRP